MRIVMRLCSGLRCLSLCMLSQSTRLRRSRVVLRVVGGGGWWGGRHRRVGRSWCVLGVDQDEGVAELDA